MVASRRAPRSSLSKIMSVNACAQWRGRVEGPVVFTNGVFDILHSGHVEVLERARNEGAALVVGINSDASVKRLKGESRPICNEEQRMIVVAAMECVDAVVMFEEDTPIAVVKAIQPDVIVKGGDYTVDTVVGRDIVQARGGRVVIVPVLDGYSTTSIITSITERIRD